MTVLEAMAHGLPVIASDWDGYRDTVQHDVTGLLTPTSMLSGSLDKVAEQFVASEITYDQFLAVTSQATVVDVQSACEQFAELACSAALRNRLGAAARKRACEHFAWPVIIARYEAMWQQQREELSRYADVARSHSLDHASSFVSQSPIYPRIDVAFRGYPTKWLDADCLFRKTSDVRDLKSTMLDRLRNHSVSWTSDIEHVLDVFDALPVEFSASMLESGFHHSQQTSSLGC